MKYLNFSTLSTFIYLPIVIGSFILNCIYDKPKNGYKPNSSN